MAAVMDYSPTHLASFQRYRDGGLSLKSLDDADLTALLEDPNFRADVMAERTRRVKAAAPSAPAAPRARSTGMSTEINPDASWDELGKQCPTASTPFGVFAKFAAFVEAINVKNIERHARIDALEQRIAELEQREYQGVWSAEKSYARGAMVSRQGSCWHSNVNHNCTTPGQHPHWTLAVKSGRDLRDTEALR